MGNAPRDVSKPVRAGARWRRWGGWISGVLILAALVVAVLHLGEIERFARLVSHIRPLWVIVALVLQAGTYVCIGDVWYLALRRSGYARPLRELATLGLAQLFTDQVVPTGGISGTALMLAALSRRGVPQPVGMGALLVELVSHYAAYLLVVSISLGLLWIYHDLNPALLIAMGVFIVVAIGIPAGILSLQRWSQRPVPAFVRHVPGLGALMDVASKSPTALLRNRALAAQTVVLQTLIFVLDAATLWVMLRALGQAVAPSAAFASYVLASAVATLGPIPVGPFEAVSVTTLGVLGVPIEAALAGTLLLRGLTFWLPMLPGLWLARREVSAAGRGA